LTLEEIQAALGPKTAMLICYLGESDEGRAVSYGLLLTREGLTAHASVLDLEGNEFEMQDGERSAVLSGLALYVQAVRNTLREEPLGRRPASAAGEQALGEVLTRCFGQLAQDLQAARAAGKDHLVVVPHDALHFAPVHLFFAGGAPLADQFTVTYLPNLALLARTQSPPAGESAAASIGLGFAEGKGPWPPIPEAVAEARAVAATMGTEALLDAQATKARVLEALGRSSRVHIATHGSLDVDAPVLQLLALHPPDAAEGALHAHEVLDLDLSRVAVVTLSACETALGRFDRADNLRGLSAALFSVGVETVVGTLWPVESNAAQEFFTAFYRSLGQGRTRLQAFGTAQQLTRARFSQYRDWGAFYLAGAWS
jgi:CHAT domain-containing protein